VSFYFFALKSVGVLHDNPRYCKNNLRISFIRSNRFQLVRGLRQTTFGKIGLDYQGFLSFINEEILCE